MSDSLIMSMYEEGRSVKEIAKAMGTAPRKCCTAGPRAAARVCSDVCGALHGR
ncbi:MAG: hypothetical protein ACYSSK_05535 [Planctomycetota bacterium]|jgi:hypothetical protein